MALAKQSTPPVSVGAFRSAQAFWRLAAPATALSVLCAGTAFVFLFLRDRNHVNVMVNEQSAPYSVPKPNALPPQGVPQTVTSPPSALADETVNLSAGNGANTNSVKNEFIVTRSSQAVTLGSLRVRVTRIDPSRHSYDMDVLVGTRFVPHRKLRVGQPLWIASNRAKGSVEIVANSVEKETVSGYWTPSSRLAQITPRRRSRRR